jgi:hypothetical protein
LNSRDDGQKLGGDRGNLPDVADMHKARCSDKALYGTRLEGFAKSSCGLMERRADYSVKPAPKQAPADMRILANAWRGRGRDEQNYPASPRLDEEQLGAMLQTQAKRS